MKVLPLLLSLLFLFQSNHGVSQLIGKITDGDGFPLSYVNIYVRNTSIGTTSNLDGFYELSLEKGQQYEIMYQYVGYKTISQFVELDDKPLTKNIRLQAEYYNLEEIVISASQEDPAYQIIRQAQRKRKYYKDLVRSYQCDAYMRGFNKIMDAPEKIMGFEIGDLDGLLDSTRQGVVYLSESVSKLYYKDGNHKEVMYSSKISGDDQGYSFNSAKEMSFNFYENSLDLNRNIISPIASSAMAFYEYKLEGAVVDKHGYLVNKIKVIPKNDYAACFHGYIYINEDLWNINSLELGVTGKATQLAFIDTLTFKQTHVPLNKETWMPFSNIIQFEMGALGFVVAGNFACVYSNYILEEPGSDIFNNEVFVVEKEANERNESYWEERRPIPLTSEEARDYVRKDSIRKIKESPEYKDSIDKEFNKFKIGHLLNGYAFQNSKKRMKFDMRTPLSNISANTIQGWNGGFGMSFNKSFNKKATRTLSADFDISYGISDKVWRPEASLRYRVNKTNNLYFTLSGGKVLSQFNRMEPISWRLNFLMTTFFKRNYLKAYNREYISLMVSRNLGPFLAGRLSMDFENRMMAFNNYDESFFYKESRDFTDNNIIPFTEHTALILRASLRIKPGETIWKYPDQIFRAGSDWPTIWIHYKKGIEALGASANYDLIYTVIEKDLNLKTSGLMNLYLSAGLFPGHEPEAFPDYFHFMGNQTHIGNAFEYKSSFMMLPYYDYSTNGSFLNFHVQHNFSGSIFSKLPLLKLLGWHMVLGYKYLKTDNQPYYTEYHLGIDNIGIKVFRLFRFDFVWSTDFESLPERRNNKFGVIVGLKADL
ncbi:MAG: carboxypeptidase-like regulatory domain-containing protein [Saprospiraceae bacterium]|nr:carboxypeptidase-like regulatory domain-containing protein [Saprospiraceae bacterium]